MKNLEKEVTEHLATLRDWKASLQKWHQAHGTEGKEVKRSLDSLRELELRLSFVLAMCQAGKVTQLTAEWEKMRQTPATKPSAGGPPVAIAVPVLKELTSESDPGKAAPRRSTSSTTGKGASPPLTERS